MKLRFVINKLSNFMGKYSEDRNYVLLSFKDNHKSIFHTTVSGQALNQVVTAIGTEVIKAMIKHTAHIFIKVNKSLLITISSVLPLLITATAIIKPELIIGAISKIQKISELEVSSYGVSIFALYCFVATLITMMALIKDSGKDHLLKKKLMEDLNLTTTEENINNFQILPLPKTKRSKLKILE